MEGMGRRKPLCLLLFFYTSTPVAVSADSGFLMRFQRSQPTFFIGAVSHAQFWLL